MLDGLFFLWFASLALGVFAPVFAGDGPPKHLEESSGELTHEPLSMWSLAAAALLLGGILIVGTWTHPSTAERVLAVVLALISAGAAYFFYVMTNQVCLSWDQRGVREGKTKFMAWDEIAYLAHRWGFPHAAVSRSGSTIGWEGLRGRKVFVAALRLRRPDLFEK
jgi:hypothetical protein